MVSIAATILLAAHLLCVNVAMTGPLACVALRWRAAGHGDPLADRLGRWLVRVCLVAVLVAVGLGLASGLLLWWSGQGQFFDALARVPVRRLYGGLAELAFYVLCLLIYDGLWHRWRARPVGHGLIAVLAATNLMYHFPPLFVLIGWLAAGGLPGAEPLSSRQLLGCMFQPAVLAPVVHHLLASVAVAGVVVMLGARRLSAAVSRDPVSTNGSGPAELAIIVRRAGTAALTATLLQLPTGLWVLLQLTGSQRDQLLGGSWMASGLFIAAMVTAVGLLHGLSAIALGQTGRREVCLAAGLLVVLTVLMSGVLREVRRKGAAAPPTQSGTQTLTAGDGLAAHRAVFFRRDAQDGQDDSENNKAFAQNPIRFVEQVPQESNILILCIL